MSKVLRTLLHLYNSGLGYITQDWKLSSHWHLFAREHPSYSNLYVLHFFFTANLKPSVLHKVALRENLLSAGHVSVPRD